MTTKWRSTFLGGALLVGSLFATPQLERVATLNVNPGNPAQPPAGQVAQLPRVNAPANPVAVNALAGSSPAANPSAANLRVANPRAAKPLKGEVRPARAPDSRLSTTVRDGVEAYSLYVPYINQMYDTDPALQGNCACGPTSVAMVLAYFGRVEPRPELSTEPVAHTNPYGWVLTDAGHTYAGTSYDRTVGGCAGSGEFGGIYGAVMNNDYELMADWGRVTAALESHGLTVTTSSDADFDRVKTALDKGHPVILTTRGLTGWGHLIVVTGYTADGRLIVNDSYGSKWDGYPNDNGEGVLYSWEDLGAVRNAWEVSGPGEGWQAQYYDARGNLFMRSDRELNFDWGQQTPGAPLDSRGYSARWTRSVYLAKGVWTLNVRSDGDIRVRVDGAVALELANKPGVQTRTLRLPLTAGNHTLQVEYRHAAGETGVVQASVTP